MKTGECSPGISRRDVREMAKRCGMRLCAGCDEIKDLSEFSDYNNRAEYRCKKCNVKRRIKSSREKATGFTQEEYDALLIQQDGRCAICRRADPNRALSADHCHRTGEKRKLLCTECNFLLSKAQDSAELLERAASYLRGDDLDYDWSLPEDHSYVSLPAFKRKEDVA